MRTTDEDSFTNYMRMTPVQFDILLSRVESDLTKFPNRGYICPVARLTLALSKLQGIHHSCTMFNVASIWLLVTMRSISYQYRIAPNTCSKIINEVCSIIWSRLLPVVFKPMSNESWERFARGFEEKFNFPFCLGAIDQNHCQIQVAKCHSLPIFVSQNINTTCPTCVCRLSLGADLSVVLLAIASANHLFIAVDIGAPGRQSDGGILSHHASRNLLTTHFLSKTHTMRPYPGKQFGDNEIMLNNRISQARMSVNIFGILASRWRVQSQASHILSRASSNKQFSYTIGCCSMKNQLAQLQEGQWKEIVTSDDALRNLAASIDLLSNIYSTTSASIREEFTNHFLSSG
ncbi:hypothetical protein PR048_029857 [Dryococelus australis]|uniref:DDE Tnp4 domain-containing protein n=1 Tax=Dryococelus australis TaxID=614101 RepID=A0ABQ9G7B8_9NEOP|nr:hypothetical protein PR048_029857 [Dryococelus australis]